MRLALLLAWMSVATCAAADRLEWSAAPVAPGSVSVFKWGHATAVDPWNDRFLAIGRFQFSSQPPAAYGFADSAWSNINSTGYLGFSDPKTIGAIDRTRHRFVILEQSEWDTSSVVPLWHLELGPDIWTPLTQSGDAPQFLFNSGAAADSADDALFLFGGRSSVAPYGQTNDVWSMSLAGAPSWTRLAPLGTPLAPREASAVAFDETNRRLLVFGGRGDAATGALNDTWSLSLDPVPSWQEVTTSRRPPAYASPVGAWDPVSEHLVVFAGAEVWELVTHPSPEWYVRRVSSSVAPPRARGYGTLTADSRTGRLYLHGGSVDFAHGPVLDPTLWILSRYPTTKPAVEAPKDVNFVRDVERLIPFTIVNPAITSRTFEWRLSASAAIPGLPASGTATAPPDGLGGIDVPITVPEGSPAYFDITLSIRATDGPADSSSIKVDLSIAFTDAVEPNVAGLRLDGAIPNPASALPRLSFHLPQPGVVRLDLLDIAGRRVASRGPMMAPAGPNLVSLAADRALAPGVYLGRLVYHGRSLITRVAIVR